MQPNNPQPEERSFLMQAVLGGIGFVFVLVLFATAAPGIDPGRFISVAEDSPPQTVVAPTTAAPAPPTTVPRRDVGEGDAEEPLPPSTTTTTTTTIVNGRPVPDVTELEVNEAILELVDWKVDFSRINHSDEEIPADFVIETRPAAGTIVAPGTSVLLIVSTGPE